MGTKKVDYKELFLKYPRTRMKKDNLYRAVHDKKQKRIKSFVKKKKRSGSV